MTQAHSRRQGRDREKRRFLHQLISSKVGATTFILAAMLRFLIILLSFDIVTCQNLLRERDQVSLLVRFFQSWTHRKHIFYLASEEVVVSHDAHYC